MFKFVSLALLLALFFTETAVSVTTAQPFRGGSRLVLPSAAEDKPKPLVSEEARLIDADSADDRPSFTLDGRTMFFGSRRYSKHPWRIPDNSQPDWKWDSDLWQRVWLDSVWSEPINLGQPINNSAGQINPTVHPRGDKVYYVGGGGGAVVWEARLVDGKFVDPRPVQGQINPIYSRKTQLGQYYLDSIRQATFRELMADSNMADLRQRAPDAFTLHWNGKMVKALKTWGALNYGRAYVRCESAITPDGKYAIISENFGKAGEYGQDGMGDEDLWFVEIDEYGRWNAVTPPNGDLNTEFKETYPFIAADGITLYFTSNRPCLTCPKGASGREDIYRTQFNGERWTDPVPLPPPFNSASDDYGFSIGPDGETAYFVSNREGKSKLFQVDLAAKDSLIRPKPVIIVQGKVTDERTGAPLKAEIFVDDLGDAEYQFSVMSDSISGNYVLALQRGHRFGLQATHDKYLPHSERFTVPLRGTFDRTKLDIALAPIEIGSIAEFKNVYFKTGRADLLRESQLELDRVVFFLVKNPNMNIEIQGHTDDVGGDAANQRLSQARASSVLSYLVKKGIRKERLTAKGYGKTRPIVPGKDEAARAQNRRVQMVVTSKSD